MELEKNEKILKALLFASDRPLASADIASAMEIDSKDVQALVDSLVIKLKNDGMPITVKEIAGGFELLTLPEYSVYIKKIYKNRLIARLSRPALEVLAIVAYKQPITKQEVELIRGVNSDGVYHTLLERKLIKIAGRKESPGRPLLYGTTKDFLQYLGVNSLEDLPKIEEIKSILEKDENVENWDDRVENARQETQETLFGFAAGLAEAKESGEHQTQDNVAPAASDAGQAPAAEADPAKIYGEEKGGTFDDMAKKKYPEDPEDERPDDEEEDWEKHGYGSEEDEEEDADADLEEDEEDEDAGDEEDDADEDDEDDDEDDELDEDDEDEDDDEDEEDEE